MWVSGAFVGCVFHIMLTRVLLYWALFVEAAGVAAAAAERFLGGAVGEAVIDGLGAGRGEDVGKVGFKEIAECELAIVVEATGHDRAVNEYTDLIAQGVTENALSPIACRHIRPVELLTGFEINVFGQSAALPTRPPRVREMPGEHGLDIAIERVKAVFIPQAQDAELPRRVHRLGKGRTLVYITL